MPRLQLKVLGRSAVPYCLLFRVERCRAGQSELAWLIRSLPRVRCAFSRCLVGCLPCCLSICIGSWHHKPISCLGMDVKDCKPYKGSSPFPIRMNSPAACMLCLAPTRTTATWLRGRTYAELPRHIPSHARNPLEALAISPSNFYRPSWWSPVMAQASRCATACVVRCSAWCCHMLSCSARLVLCRAGDLVLWDSVGAIFKAFWMNKRT